MAVLKLVVGVGLISHYLCRYYKNSGWDAEERCQSDMFPFFMCLIGCARSWKERNSGGDWVVWDVSFSRVYHDPDGLGPVSCFFSPSMSFGGRHEPRGSEKLIIPRGCEGFRGWGEGAARAQREGCVKGLSCVVITMGCHMRYLNHSLFKCFVYYTRLLLGFSRPVLACPVTSIAFLHLDASPIRQTSN